MTVRDADDGRVVVGVSALVLSLVGMSDLEGLCPSVLLTMSDGSWFVSVVWTVCLSGSEETVLLRLSLGMKRGSVAW